ncbi:MAG: MBL fold metallo-hydrolase [Bacteroidota bacterium]
MKITFLGTGTSQGIPVIGCSHEVCLSENKKDKRLRSSVAIQIDDDTYIIDCGPDFRQQMLNQNISKISGILFTHFHADHTAGLDDIRPFTQSAGSLPIFARKDVIDSLKERFDYIFLTVNRYIGAPRLIINEIDNNPFQLNNLKVIPIEVIHGKLKIFGYRFNNIAYITDAKMVSEEEKRKLKNLDVLVINALRIDSHPTHFNLEEALEFIAEINPQKAYLTHISHKLGFHDKVSKTLPKNIFLAYDGLSLEI